MTINIAVPELRRYAPDALKMLGIPAGPGRRLRRHAHLDRSRRTAAPCEFVQPQPGPAAVDAPAARPRRSETGRRGRRRRARGGSLLELGIPIFDFVCAEASTHRRGWSGSTAPTDGSSSTTSRPAAPIAAPDRHTDRHDGDPTWSTDPVTSSPYTPSRHRSRPTPHPVSTHRPTDRLSHTESRWATRTSTPSLHSSRCCACRRRNDHARTPARRNHGIRTPRRHQPVRPRASASAQWGSVTPDWRSWVLDETQSQPLLERAVELGITFFDTSNFYSGGESERVLGRALNRLLPREDYVLATKVGNRMGDARRRWATHASTFIAAVEDSLRRLDVDYIDLYQTHVWRPDTNIEETLEPSTG